MPHPTASRFHRPHVPSLLPETLAAPVARCISISGVLSTLFLPVWACGEAPAPSLETGDFGNAFDHGGIDVEQVELSGRVLIHHPALGEPSDIELTDTILWVADRATDPSLHMFYAATGELLASLGRAGDGPGEFRSYPHRLQPDPSGRGGVWAWDGGHDRLSFFHTDGPADPARSIIVFRSHPYIGPVRWLTRDRLIGVNNSVDFDETLVVFDSLGAPVAAFAREMEAPEGTSDDDLREAWAEGVKVCLRPTGDRMALASSALGRIDLYDLSGRLIVIGQATAPFASQLPFAKDDETGQWEFRYSATYYLSCTVSEDEFMLVFVGGGPTLPGGEWIHVFDWDGELRRIYHLDRYVNHLALSDDGTRLFASVSADADIVVYELSDK